MEQEPINAGVSRALHVPIEEIDAVKHPHYIREYSLTATPTILILKDGTVADRFEGVVHAEQLESVLKKYL
jgi:thioredoxin-like negative regulator of GroEL